MTNLSDIAHAKAAFQQRTLVALLTDTPHTQPSPTGGAISGDDDMLSDKLKEAVLTSRIADIDTDFEAATSWGSWMVSAANEREHLVNDLAKIGVTVPHKNLARSGAGGKVD